MDAIVERIAAYAHGLKFADLPAHAIHHCTRCVVDTFGCALGAFDAEPPRIARQLAERTHAASGGRVIGTAHRALPELAAFANGVMGRYLDANDTFNSGGGHPSDTIAAVMAISDSCEADGHAVITAITLAYEVYHKLWRAAQVFDKGLDHAFYTAVAGAVGAAKVLGLGPARIAHAISLAITPNVPLVATRYGHLSMWKGCAGGNAARNGVFAAVLAQAGMTGPDKPVEGDHGLQNLVGRFDLSPFAGSAIPFAITEVTLKYFASVAQSLSPITVALQLSQQVAAEDIESVTLYTYNFAWEVTGKEREKWRPATREAADHSLPYIVAAVLIDGAFSDASFAEERLRDPRILQLIDKIEVKEDQEFTRRFPECLPCRIEITTKRGERKVMQTDNARGHYKNPMSDEEVNVKFQGLAHRVLSRDRIEVALDALWGLEDAADLNAIFAAVKTDA